jgi:acetylornithine deacetylase
MGLAADYSFAGRPQLIARWRGEGGGPSLLLNGHVDVVDPGPDVAWGGDPFRARVAAGRLIGRGAADMKSGVAAMIVAVEALRAAGVRLAGDLVVNTVTDEESTGAGSVASVQRGLGADAGLIPEPTSLDVWLGARGSLCPTITVQGRAGHAGLSQPHWSAGGAVNAVDKMRVVLGALEGVSREWRVRHASTHAHLAPGAIIPTAIHADAWMVSHPGTCTLDCHLQYLPAQADSQGWGVPVQAEVEQALRIAAQADSWLREHPPHVTWSPDVPASLVDAGAPIVHSALEAGRTVGRDPRIARETTFFDGPTFTRAGIPTIAFGPGDIVQAHAADEHVVIDEVVAAAQAIAVAAMRFCGVVARPRAAAAPVNA